MRKASTGSIEAARRAGIQTVLHGLEIHCHCCPCLNDAIALLCFALFRRYVQYRIQNVIFHYLGNAHGEFRRCHSVAFNVASLWISLTVPPLLDKD